MKKVLLYILLVSYSTLLLKPLIPYVSDMVAHAFWYSKHMATVHYVDGKFHVHKTIMQEEKRNGADKNPFTEKKNQPQPEYLITYLNPVNLQADLLSKNYPRRLTTPLFSAYLKKDFPPPKCLATIY